MKSEEDILKEILAEEFCSEESKEVVIFEPKEVASNPEDRSTDIKSDYEETRRVLRQSIQRMDEASKQALLNVMMADSPRMMEVFTQLMTAMGNTADKLLKVHKEMKELDGQGPTSGVPGTINADKVFIGTSDQLLDALGGAQDKFDENYIDVKASEITGE